MLCACTLGVLLIPPLPYWLQRRCRAPPPPESSLPTAPGRPERLPAGPGLEVPTRHLRTCTGGKRGRRRGRGRRRRREGGREEGDGGGNPGQQHQRRQSAPVHCAAPHGSGRRAAAVLSPGRSCCGLPGFLLPPQHPRSSSSSFSLLRLPPPAARLPLRGSLCRGHAAAPPGGRGRSVLPLQLGQGLAWSRGREKQEEGEEAAAAERPLLQLNLCCRVQVLVSRTDTEPPARPAAALSCYPKWKRRPWDSPGRMGNRGRCRKTCKVRGETQGAPPPRTLGFPSAKRPFVLRKSLRQLLASCPVAARSAPLPSRASFQGGLIEYRGQGCQGRGDDKALLRRCKRGRETDKHLAGASLP